LSKDRSQYAWQNACRYSLSHIGIIKSEGDVVMDHEWNWSLVDKVVYI